MARFGAEFWNSRRRFMGLRTQAVRQARACITSLTRNWPVNKNYFHGGFYLYGFLFSLRCQVKTQPKPALDWQVCSLLELSV